MRRWELWGGSDFSDFGTFIKAVIEGGDSRLKRLHESSGALKDMGESVGASGGFLVPMEYRTRLEAVMAESSEFAKRATVLPMRRRQIMIPSMDQTGTSKSHPNWFGGMRGYWTAEAGLKVESDMEVKQNSIIAHKVCALIEVSDELLEDSAESIEAILSGERGFAGLLAWMTDRSLAVGTGVGQPRGIIGAPGTRVITRTTPGTFGYEDLVNMREGLLPSAVRGAGWWFTPGSLSTLCTMVYPAGRDMVWPAAAIGGIPEKILGVPVMGFSEHLPQIGYVGDVLLANWSFYWLGNRKSTTVESDEGKGTKFAYDITRLRAERRVGGQPQLSSVITLADGIGTECAPFVTLSGTSET